MYNKNDIYNINSNQLNNLQYTAWVQNRMIRFYGNAKYKLEKVYKMLWSIVHRGIIIHKSKGLHCNRTIFIKVEALQPYFTSYNILKQSCSLWGTLFIKVLDLVLELNCIGSYDPINSSSILDEQECGHRTNFKLGTYILPATIEMSRLSTS